MRWSWNDVQELPNDVYCDLVDWLNDDSGEDVIDMDA